MVESKIMKKNGKKILNIEDDDKEEVGGERENWY